MNKKRRRLTYFIIAFSMILSFTGYWFYQMIFSPNVLIPYKETDPTTNKQVSAGRDSVWFTIPEGMTFSKLRTSLYDNKIIHDQTSFAFVAKIMGYQDKVKPGLYLFRANWSNRDAIRHLRSGKQWVEKITFNNLRLKTQLPDKLAKNLFKPEMIANDLSDLLDDSAKCESYGFTTETIGCMFIPNTYEVYKNTTALQLMDKMKKEYDKFWTEDKKKLADRLGLTQIEVSILASIVEAETNQNTEKPRVAGVYINRLNKGMLLQADPTVIFAHQDFTIKRVLNSHLEIDSKYNTYKYTGLPPGPIRIPSQSSINAVLNYEMHDYIYFCANPELDGTHSFAKTLSEHNRNAKLYAKALNERGIR